MRDEGAHLPSREVGSSGQMGSTEAKMVPMHISRRHVSFPIVPFAL